MMLRSLCAAAAVAVCAPSFVPSAAAATVPNVIDGDWSKPVDGIRARLVETVVVPARGGDPSVSLDLEIENVSDVGNAIAIPWTVQLDQMLPMTVTDGAGKVVTRGAAAGSFAGPPNFPILLPVGSSIHLPISRSAYERIGANGATLNFRPTTFSNWPLPATHTGYKVSAKLTPPANVKIPDGARAWRGPLDVPGVALP